MRLCNVLFTACVALIAAKRVEQDCASHERTIADLERDLAEAKASQCEPFSVIDPAIKVYSFASTAASHVYEFGQRNEQVSAVASRVYDHSRRIGVIVAEKVSTVDYEKRLQDLQASDFYRTHVALRVDQAVEAAKPHMDNHVYPAVEKAKVYLQAARDHAFVAYKRSHEEALPVLKAASTKTATLISEIPVDKAISPVFELLEKIAPSQAKALPKKTFDRVLFLLVVMFILFESIYWGAKLFRIVMFFVRAAFKITFFMLHIALFIPVRLAYKVLRITMCICTGFYCCGLCRRRQKNKVMASAESAKSTAKADKQTVSKAGKESATSGTAVTVADLQQFLDQRKNEKRDLNEFAKQFAELVKSGKPMTAKQHKGKTISKDVLVKALAKYPDVNVKQLKL